ncbi:MAG: ATP-binding protein [Chitinophagales bacterium]
MIKRAIQQPVIQHLFKGKVVIIYGPRQVGKTTLVQQIVEPLNMPVLWLNGDEADIRKELTDITSTQLKALFGNYKLVIIDEAQKIESIGNVLKLVTDTIKDVQVIATGSSSFELANQLNEPLTGRKYEYHLFPFSTSELIKHNGHFLEEKRLLHYRMQYGFYPEVVNHPGNEIENLKLIANSYLYKDILSYQQIRKPQLVEKLVQALALQAGNEVSYNELAQVCGTDNVTVEKYITYLEQAFVIFRLTAFSRNLRNELKKARKIYFWDVGIRNAIINNFNVPALRQDKGPLWENFIVAERLKYNAYRNQYSNNYFWRTIHGAEIDYLEDYGGTLHAYEIKWNATVKVKKPKTFAETYPQHEFETVNTENYLEFIIDSN